MDTIPSSETAVNCPKCQGLFRLPAGLSKNSVLGCPHCEVELGVHDVIEAIPVARVTGSTASPSPAAMEAPLVRTTSAENTGSRHAVDDQHFTIPKPLKTALRPGHQVVESPSDARKASSRSSSSRRSPFAKRKSGSMELLKVVLGALLAVPVAQLVLWWLFAADPLALAPRVQSVFPQIVPPAMRPVVPDEPDEEYVPRDLPKGVQLNDTAPVSPLR